MIHQTFYRPNANTKSTNLKMIKKMSRIRLKTIEQIFYKRNVSFSLTNLEMKRKSQENK